MATDARSEDERPHAAAGTLMHAPAGPAIASIASLSIDHDRRPILERRDARRVASSPRFVLGDTLLRLADAPASLRSYSSSRRNRPSCLTTIGGRVSGEGYAGVVPHRSGGDTSGADPGTGGTEAGSDALMFLSV